ncbi:calcium-binding protein [Rhizobium sp.]
MPVIKGNKNDTQDISGTGKTWTVAASAKIRADEFGIFENSVSSGNRLKILGSVTGVVSEAEPNPAAVYSFGLGTQIEVAKSARLTGYNGIISRGDDVRIENAGRITSNGNIGIGALDFSATATIVNSGKITGDAGIYLTVTSGSITNAKSGTIVGQEVGVQMLGFGDALKLTNHGKITGIADDGHAVLGGEEIDKVINYGTIKGAVDLGGGDDRFEFKGGKIDHAVEGGEGDDTLVTNRASVKLREQDADGFDTVRASVTYKLGDYVEQLVLTGKKNIDGTGSAQDNTLIGNSGKNTLKGMDGGDLLSGGKGADTLFGGAGEDVFELTKGSGKDTVKDFVDGTDFIRVRGFDGIFTAEDIEPKHIVDKGADTWIVMSKTDILVLKNVDAALIDADDFSFVM